MNLFPHTCSHLDLPGHADVAACARAMSPLPSLDLGQAWLDQPDPGLAQGTVKTAWNESGLLVLAELEDRDIITNAASPNDPLWALGDTLEIFLRPPGSEAYWEFHVAPNNLRLRLMFPEVSAVYCRKKEVGSEARPELIIAPFVLEEDFESRVIVADDRLGWSVFARFPYSLFDRHTPEPGELWAASFSRYDYSRNSASPVISSTSPHRKPDFHDQADWGVLRLMR